ncbi:hypothetical protein LINGRAHAP2_LOCUS30559, partial [Linum grandiflorum]
EEELRRTITRGELFLATHKKDKKKKKFPKKPIEDMYVSIKNQVERNVADPNIPTEFNPNDVVGRYYKRKEKSGRVRHMEFSKRPSVVFGLSTKTRGPPYSSSPGPDVSTIRVTYRDGEASWYSQPQAVGYG